MESLANAVVGISLSITAAGATVGGMVARSLAKQSEHRTALTVAGAAVGGLVGFLSVPWLARLQAR